MVYKIIRKDPIYKDDFTKPAQLAVYIMQEEPHTQIIRTISGDFFDKADDDIIAETLEQFYQETYLNRAENEKFKEVNKQLEESTKALDTARKALAENTLVTYENQAEIEELGHKINVILEHLNLEITEGEENDEENKEESTENARESTNI